MCLLNVGRCFNSRENSFLVIKQSSWICLAPAGPHRQTGAVHSDQSAWCKAALSAACGQIHQHSSGLRHEVLERLWSCESPGAWATVHVCRPHLITQDYLRYSGGFVSAVYRAEIACEHWWLMAADGKHTHTHTRLPAAVALGRSDTVMSGGKLILGGSSPSAWASGPSAMLLRSHTVHPNLVLGWRSDTVFPRIRSSQRPEDQTRWIKINKRDCVDDASALRPLLLPDCDQLDGFKGETLL